MSTIDSALYDRLGDVAGELFPIVGTRIYPVDAPQDVTIPYVVWTRISENRYSAMGLDTKIVEMRIQLDAFDLTFVKARLLNDAMRKRLQRWRAASPMVIQDAFIIDTAETREGVSAVPLYRATLQAQLFYEEA